MTNKTGERGGDAVDELAKARARIAELEARIVAEEELRKEHAHWLIAALDSAGIGAWTWDIALDKITWTKPLLALYGVDEASFGGKLQDFMVFVHEEDKEFVSAKINRVFTQAEDSYHVQHRVVRVDGSMRWTIAHGFVERDGQGKPYRLSGVAQDITEQVLEAEERHAMQQRIIDAQRESLRQLGAPIIPLTKNALAMPLVGTLSPERATLVTETLLQAVTQRAAEYVILDVTGVPGVDTEVADGLLRVAQAVRILGADVALTGMQPAVARALVELGVDMSAFVTKADLQSGIAWASKRGNVRL